MGYRKGFIDISRDRDVPLLEQVLSCQIVSRSQLLAFLRLRRFESSRQAYNWRVRRLAEHELLFVHQVPSISREDLIALSPQGIACLEAHGKFFAAAFPAASRNLKELNLLHTLELNNIQLALLESGILIGWTPEIQLRSSLLWGSSVHAKTYDAIVNVMWEDELVRFALEYERSQKSTEEYWQVRKSLESDAGGPPVLYLFPSHNLLSSVARHFRGGKLRLWFGLVEEFKSSLFEAHVSDARGFKPLPLRQAFSRG
jgi:hypothetical protein